jgi:hypothetical protein
MARSPVPPYQHLIDRLTERGTPVVDLSLAMPKRLAGRSPCELAAQVRACTGHFNAEGNALVAEIVHAALERVTNGLK